MLIGFGGNIANIIIAATILTTSVTTAIPFPIKFSVAVK